jgi:CheY-like chemotaxis protein
VPRCLLLVEDERSLLKAFSHAFTKAGYEVLEAADVPGALTQWGTARDRIALILSDVQMPGPPVEELIAAAREEKPQVPILLMTGEVGGDDDRAARLREHANGFLRKPIRLDALKREVERLIASER